MTGTCAIDLVGRYPKSFDELPQQAGMNISFELAKLRRSFGGCAMNIAVNLARLGHHATPVAFLGNDAAEFVAELHRLGVDCQGLIQTSDAAVSSHALIVTDEDDNQLTAFYPGPSRTGNFRLALERTLAALAVKPKLVVIAPDIASNVLDVQAVCREQDLPFITDPGQCLMDYTPHECAELVASAKSLCLNEYEHRYLTDHNAIDVKHVPLLIITRGANGIRWRDGSSWYHERSAKPEAEVDPTGCGDAFRAGLIHAHLAGANWRDAVRSGATCASINMAHVGTQTYSLDGYRERYEATWQESPSWLDKEIAT